jgi:hypothetical protein
VRKAAEELQVAHMTLVSKMSRMGIE